MESTESSRASREAILFLALTLALSYLVFWGPLAVFQITAISFVSNQTGPPWAIALYIVGGFVPSGVAVALVGLLEGKPGLRGLWSRITQFRIGWPIYVATVGIVVFGTICQVALNNLLGHIFDLKLFLIQLPSLLPLLVLGPLSEELGWRGYAQGRLQTRWSPQVSAVIVGSVWAFWHLPLFFMPGTSQHELNIPFIGFLLGILSMSLLFAWQYNHTGGSIWAAIFFHWIYTYAGQVVATGVTRSSIYNWLEYMPYVLAAATVVIAWKRQLNHRLAAPSRL